MISPTPDSHDVDNGDDSMDAITNIVTSDPARFSFVNYRKRIHY